jgi:hypothetical protein
VFVDDAVLAEAGVVVPDDADEDADELAGEEGEPEDAEDEVERFREFLDSVSPDDFGGDQKP